MSIKIDSKIIGQEVVKPDEKPVMDEKLERPDVIGGQTYKIKTPLSEHALYVTINDIEVAGQIRPFEIFINSKNMDHFQWIVALTRLVSAVFRKGGDCTFLADELRSVFDPKGGYFKRGGRFMPSLVAEIGDVIEQHLKHIGMIEDKVLDAHQAAYVEEKKKEHGGEYPEQATLCGKCSTKAVVQMDGCMTCLSCGDSKCG